MKERKKETWRVIVAKRNREKETNEESGNKKKRGKQKKRDREKDG